jgi:hypothetical protein
MAVRHLATSGTHTSVEDVFGIANSTCVKVCKRFIKALVNSTMPLYLHWHDAEAMALIKTGFENTCHEISQVCIAIDCTHIKFDRPAYENTIDWYDHDHNYFMILQSIVDHQSRFIDAFVEFLGSVHDARVFQQSNHQDHVANGSHLHGPTWETQCIDVQEFLIGNVGYIGSCQLAICLFLGQV